MSPKPQNCPRSAPLSHPASSLLANPTLKIDSCSEYGSPPAVLLSWSSALSPLPRITVQLAAPSPTLRLVSAEPLGGLFEDLSQNCPFSPQTNPLASNSLREKSEDLSEAYKVPRDLAPCFLYGLVLLCSPSGLFCGLLAVIPQIIGLAPRGIHVCHLLPEGPCCGLNCFPQKKHVQILAA